MRVSDLTVQLLCASAPGLTLEATFTSTGAWLKETSYQAGGRAHNHLAEEFQSPAAMVSGAAVVAGA